MVKSVIEIENCGVLAIHRLNLAGSVHFLDKMRELFGISISFVVDCGAL